jgi:ferredoxin
MKVSVDDDRCAGHGVCCALCPAVFALTDDGFAIVRAEEVPDEHIDAVREAVKSCPERAITVS